MTEVIVRPLLVKCLGYLDPDSLWQVCFLSKEFEDMVRNNPGIENKLIRVLEISPDKNKHDAGDLTMEVITNMLKANRLIPDKNKNVERYAITSIKKRSENLRELQEKTSSEIDAIGRSIYDQTQDENSAKFPESWDFEKILKNLDVKCQEILTLL